MPRVLVLPGDGIGPEVTAEAAAVLRQIAPDVQLEERLIGGCAIDAEGAPLSDATVARAKECGLVLLGAVGGPKWDDPKSTVRPEQALLGIRQALGLFANLRPVKAVESLLATSTLKPEVVRGVDILVIRELTGGIYFGKPSERRQGAAGREAQRRIEERRAHDESTFNDLGDWRFADLAAGLGGDGVWSSGACSPDFIPAGSGRRRRSTSGCRR
jgi:3-isopropylmalate dehydrogenase